MNILGTPSKSQILEMNPKIREKIKLPQKNSIDWKKFFGNKINNDEFIDLVSKLLVYEPTVRLSPYEALCHPFFDELRNLDLNLPNGKKLPNHLFEFKPCEINYDKENIHFLLSQIQK
jgi:serine/threonine protein kinase